MWWFATTVSAWGAGPEPVAYALRPDGDGVEITLRFHGARSGRSRVLVPDRWAGQEGLGAAIHDLRVASDGATLRGSGRVRTVTHPPDAELELVYRLVGDGRDPGSDAPIEDERYYRAITGGRGVHFAAQAGIVVPALDPDEQRPLSLRWDGLPEGWIAADSWGHGPDRAWTGTLDELAAGLFVAGPLQLDVIDVDGRAVGAVWTGHIDVDRQVTVDALGRIVAAERAFWRDPGPNWFLVSFLDVGRGCCTVAGTGLSHAFAAFLSVDGGGLDRQVGHVLAHELFHAWNGSAMQPAPPEERMYWFTEGFTEYYSRLIELRAGAIDLPTYVAELDDAVAEYLANPLHLRGSGVVRRRFWRDPNAERLPYLRGELIALGWRAALREAGASLDDVMRDLLAADTPLTPATVEAAIRRRADIGAAEQIREHVVAGREVPLVPGALGPCYTLGTLPGFDPGFDVDATVRAGLVVGVRPDGPAFAAGLRDGVTVTRLSVYNGDTTKPIVVGVRDETGEERAVSYPPLGPRGRPGWVLAEPEAADAASSTRCTAWFDP